MAYDQGYYQAPQRPYNGRAAQPPTQAYAQAPAQYQRPAQGYSDQGPYDQYVQDEYSLDDGYGNGYAQSYDSQYQQYPGNARGGGGRGQYPPQNQGYPPSHDYYGNGRGRGGGDPGPQSRNGGRGGAAYGRPPTANSERGGYDNRGMRGGRGYSNGNNGTPNSGMARGYPNGNGGSSNSGGRPTNGDGGRPQPLGRNNGSDPGSRQRIPPPQPSPQEVAWDTPFPSFPRAKKKSSISEEQKITKQMESMDLNESRQNPPELRNGPDPRMDIPPRAANFSRSAKESPKVMPLRTYPPDSRQPGNMQSLNQLPGLPPGREPAPGFGVPSNQNRYGPTAYEQGYGSASTPTSPVRDDFGPITRSMTLPNNVIIEPSNGGSRHPPQASLHGPEAGLPYNGPVGRGPPRPATANDVRPPLQQQTYTEHPHQPPYNSQPTPQQYGGSYGPPSREDYSHQPNESISDFYDAYYEPESPPNGDYGHMPAASGGPRRGMSMEDANRMPQRRQVNGYPPASHTESQPDYRAQVQPQSAIYEMVGDAPLMPEEQSQQGYDARHGQYGRHNQPQNNQGLQNVGPGYNNGAPTFYDQHQRNMGNPRQNGSAVTGTFPGPGSYDNNNGNLLPRNNSIQQPSTQASPDALPSHPPPVRAGLIPNSVANQANNKPPPVRNYNGAPNPAQPQSVSPQPTTKAPSSGSPLVTLDELERLKVMVKNNPNDQVAQLTLARKWIEAADVLTSKLEPKVRNKAREKYIFDAHKILKKLVAAQNADAMFFLADCYGRGALGLEADNKEAFSLYQSAAKAGHAGAAYRTAVCCELGNEEGGGTRKDPLKAIQWYQRAATLGDSPAMYKMGMIQLKGLLGQPKNPREALVWLKRAAERADAENPHALHELGLLYESQQPPGSIIRDEAYALSLFKQGAELGYKFSQFRLGCAYEYGLLGLPIDARQSIMWYSRAAVQEEHQSELALSGWYLTGSEGVLQQSDTEAYLWARKAAMAGLAKAEYAMGYFTEVGIGAPADLEGAKRWYWRAAAQNFPKARERLEDLKKGGGKGQIRTRERVSRSKIGKANEGECIVM